MKINHRFKLNKWLLTLTLALSGNVWAEPIIVEGVVPNDASKQIILNKMYSVYGADQVIDKIRLKQLALLMVGVNLLRIWWFQS